MAEYRININTTAEQEIGVADALEAENGHRAAQSSPLVALAADEYISQFILAAIDAWVLTAKENESRAVADAFKTADDATVAAVKSTLKI